MTETETTLTADEPRTLSGSTPEEATADRLNRGNGMDRMERMDGATWMEHIEEHPTWPQLARAPETVTALLPLRRFTVRSLLRLAAGQTIESEQPVSGDIPLLIGPVQIAWGEFEVVEHTMALRVTRIA